MNVVLVFYFGREKKEGGNGCDREREHGETGIEIGKLEKERERDG